MELIGLGDETICFTKVNGDTPLDADPKGVRVTIKGSKVESKNGYWPLKDFSIKKLKKKDPLIYILARATIKLIEKAGYYLVLNCVSKK
jgi:hypothetical protein